MDAILVFVHLGGCWSFLGLFQVGRSSFDFTRSFGHEDYGRNFAAIQIPSHFPITFGGFVMLQQ